MATSSSPRSLHGRIADAFAKKVSRALMRTTATSIQSTQPEESSSVPTPSFPMSTTGPTTTSSSVAKATAWLTSTAEATSEVTTKAFATAAPTTTVAPANDSAWLYAVVGAFVGVLGLFFVLAIFRCAIRGTKKAEGQENLVAE